MMNRAVFPVMAAACVVLALGASHLMAQESALIWPQFRGLGGQGISAEKNLPVKWSQTESILWKIDLPGKGASSPIVVGDRIFLTCYSGAGVDQIKRHLLCVSRDDGRILWNSVVPAKLPEQANIREDHGYASSTPAAGTQRIYCFFGKSGVYAFDHEGRQVWHADVGDKLNGWGSAASPVIVGDLLIVNASVESESLVALDKKTGKEVWRAGGIKESWNAPVLVSVDGRQELVVAIMGKILGFDPATGAQLWSCNTEIRWYMVPGIAVGDGIVYGIGGRSGVAALAVRAGGRGDVTATHRIWTGNKGSNVSSPIIHEGHLYWAHENLGIAYCAEASTGRIVYEERLAGAGQFYASPVLAGGKLYYVNRTGRTYVLAARPGFEQLAVNELRDGSTFNATPAVGGGRIYIRSDRALYCIGGG